VSRTLLVKGLEYDHVLLPDIADFDDAKNLYVALTRGSKSLTVLSKDRYIARPRPDVSGHAVEHGEKHLHRTTPDKLPGVNIPQQSHNAG
jgi:ATP-dependent exoDNAse (exonuclease V) beta subunit